MEQPINSVHNGSNSLDNLEHLLKEAEENWQVLMAKDSVSALDIALPFLDRTSVGMASQYPEFKELERNLFNGLQNVVFENFNAFNDSVAAYQVTREKIGKSQNIIKEINGTLEQSGKDIMSNKEILKELNNNSQKYEQIIETLDQIEILRKKNVEIEALIDKKAFYKVERLLAESWDICNQYNLNELESLSHIKENLEVQSNNLVELVVEELHSIIYLKNIKRQEETHEELKTYKKIKDFLFKFENNYNFFDMINKEVAFIDNDYEYVYLLLKTLKNLNSLDETLNSLKSRLSTELQFLFNSIQEEIKSSNGKNIQVANLDMTDLDSFGISDIGNSVLQSFFSRIFNRCCHVLEFLLVTYKISEIVSENSNCKLNFQFSDLWDIFSAEISNLMLAYISKSESSDKSQHSNDKHMFQFNSLDFKNTKAETFSIDLQSILQDLFPNYDLKNPITNSVYIKDDFSVNKTTLIPPNVFNMSVILNNLLQFIHLSLQLVSIVANEKIDPALLCDRFMETAFLPRLQHLLDGIFQSLFKDGTVDTESYHNVFKTFFSKVCDILNTSIIYKSEYVRIILKLLNKMSSLYSECFNKHFGGTGKNTKTVQLVVNSSLRNASKIQDFAAETSILLSNNFMGQVTTRDFLTDEELTQLIKLLTSIDRMLEWLLPMRRVGSSLNQDHSNDNDEKVDFLKDKWLFLEGSPISTVLLTFSKDSVVEFDSQVDTFYKLMTDIKLILRYDLRLKIGYFVSQMFLTETWLLPYERNRPSLLIESLNKKILQIDHLLTNRDYKTFVFQGVSSFANKLFIKGASDIVALNEHGIGKLYSNIIILQQVLRTLVDDPDEINFSSCINYYEMFKKTDKGIVDQVSRGENRYSYEENAQMIKLYFSEGLSKQMNTGKKMSFGADKRCEESIQALKNLYK
ncbi:Exocyst complex component [Komagataella phaffii]|uniref:Exocyst complex component Sec8 n=1 Tax=Komagataella phaffii (strain GS115 / ATCC 20864) TaxID=644223 RepID=C4QZG5_KOMPG|nr:Essential 121kDa subunit of the exocyst complex (Sec3p, Sec5p, Sec6p, Sec8p, Sec10p, Sec15p, Exo70p [Komagataella phaffii GS115]AOA62807.1 GQ67_00064T0 [Komagataella phaffii]AOA67276.1 GQ68_01323T0 [Komagataella phaffii GS115]CAY68639.1 Essential 121kDa subunit of the exocyst complex (Sec3p, Sec5p, Sec6p, Sec8p, Sec10p, Sec15p, Exo70p [Komagataella phaffii GS115]